MSVWAGRRHFASSPDMLQASLANSGRDMQADQRFKDVPPTARGSSGTVAGVCGMQQMMQVCGRSWSNAKRHETAVGQLRDRGVSDSGPAAGRYLERNKLEVGNSSQEACSCELDRCTGTRASDALSLRPLAEGRREAKQVNAAGPRPSRLSTSPTPHSARRSRLLLGSRIDVACLSLVLRARNLRVPSAEPPCTKNNIHLVDRTDIVQDPILAQCTAFPQHCR
jgi:hypothetical protein